MRRRWTDIGEEYTANTEDLPNRRAQLSAGLDESEWKPISNGAELPAGQGGVINSAIKEFRLSRVSAVCIYGPGISAGFIVGVEFNPNSGGRERLWIASDGVVNTPIALDSMEEAA